MTVNEKDYQVIRLLGKGKGGYSYLVTDGEEKFVLKQIHHEPCDYYQFGDKMESELRDYQRLSDLGLPMPKLLDQDRQQERILKEFIDGPVMMDLALQDEVKPEHLRQVQEMASMLESHGLNIDYFPTNFVERAGKLYYIDYECNAYDPKWNFENWGIRYWSRTPELEAYTKDRGI